ncbi:GNAT family protein [Erwinia pyri]|uniref:GNAT family protein n=1 Tax=Erwinia pyri TaxID=3062598 RepID=A0AA50DII8_9GAMM|nr:GNAT family protein [Erwinia sp. DE2]WLS78535.1 GNAT family protein [Erwinia sp. DE2]
MQLDFFQEQDKPLLRSWFASQREVTQWAGPGVEWPLSDAFLETLLDSASQKPARLLTFAARQEEDLAAVAQLGFDWDNHFACLCRVVVNPALRGQKLAERMGSMLVESAFLHLQPAVERIELHVYPFNKAAVRTYEKLGFVHEGVRRACVAVGDERWDCAFYGLLRTEYTGRGADLSAQEKVFSADSV